MPRTISRHPTCYPGVRIDLAMARRADLRREAVGSIMGVRESTGLEVRDLLFRAGESRWWGRILATETRYEPLTNSMFPISPPPFHTVTLCKIRLHYVDSRGLCCSPLCALTMSWTSQELSPGSRATNMPPLGNGISSHEPRAHYEPPWSNTSIIGIAGSSGSGKTSLSLAIIRELSLPWVVLMSMDSFYKPLTANESAAAFRNEYDFDAPDAIDFDNLVERLREIKSG